MRGRISRRAVPVVALLTIALGLPEVKWCGLTWADVAPECMVVCSTPLPCPAMESSCDAMASEGCGGSMQCPPALCEFAPASSLDTHAMSSASPAPSHDATHESDRTSPSATSRSSGRAWFPADAPGGTAPRAQSLDHPPSLAIVIPVVVLEDDAVRWQGGPVLATERPPEPTPHARPPVRAPPLD